MILFSFFALFALFILFQKQSRIINSFMTAGHSAKTLKWCSAIGNKIVGDNMLQNVKNLIIIRIVKIVHQFLSFVVVSSIEINTCEPKIATNCVTWSRQLFCSSIKHASIKYKNCTYVLWFTFDSLKKSKAELLIK